MVLKDELISTPVNRSPFMVKIHYSFDYIEDETLLKITMMGFDRKKMEGFVSSLGCLTEIARYWDGF